MDNAGDRSDNSITGGVVLGFQYAETDLPQGFSIPIPQFVKDELNIWRDYIQKDLGPADDGMEDDHDGGSGYSAPDDWVNILNTGNLPKEMAFVGDKEALNNLCFPSFLFFDFSVALHKRF